MRRNLSIVAVLVVVAAMGVISSAMGDRKAIAQAPADQPQPVRFTVSRDSAHEWRWHLQSKNWRISADSGEGYINFGDCTTSVARVAAEICAGYEVKIVGRE